MGELFYLILFLEGSGAVGEFFCVENFDRWEGAGVAGTFASFVILESPLYIVGDATIDTSIFTEEKVEVIFFHTWR